jgi:hypothetical protein
MANYRHITREQKQQIQENKAIIIIMQYSNLISDATVTVYSLTPFSLLFNVRGSQHVSARSVRGLKHLQNLRATEFVIQLPCTNIVIIHNYS